MDENVQVGKLNKIWEFGESKSVLCGPKLYLSSDEVRNGQHMHNPFK